MVDDKKKRIAKGAARRLHHRKKHNHSHRKHKSHYHSHSTRRHRHRGDKVLNKIMKDKHKTQRR